MTFQDSDTPRRTRIFELMRQHDAANEFVSQPEPPDEARASADDLDRLCNMAIRSLQKPG